MQSLASFSSLLDETYALALTSRNWLEVLPQVARLFDARSTYIVTSVAETQPKVDGCIYRYVDPGAGILRGYEEVRVDPLMLRVQSLPRGEPTVAREIHRDGEILRTEFGAFAVSVGMAHAVYIMMPPVDDRSTLLCMFRDTARAPFADEDVALFRDYARHVDRAVRIGTMAGTARNRIGVHDAAMLQLVYGLTRRETDLMAVFLETRNIRRSAEELGLGWETARRHLKSVFEKTGTHSQVELIYFLLTEPARRQVHESPRAA